MPLIANGSIPKDGSPCLTCNACTDPELNGLVEYDVAGLGGDDAQVEEWLAFYRSRSSIGPQRRVLFFDECHALSRKAQDRLLDIVEDPPPALSFSFATTAPWKLQPALRSRLNPVSVRSLNPSHSLKFLEHIAAKEGISFDREALVLLAGIKKGFPRDLLTGLEQVVGKGGHISVSSVREAFDVDDVDHLIEYVLALFNGAPQKQRDALLAWQLSDGEKANWILVLLTSIYYNQVIGVDTIIDPLIYADNRGRQVYEAFAHKARAVGREPAKAWLCMRQFWTAPVRTTDLQLALFEELVNDLLRADFEKHDSSGA